MNLDWLTLLNSLVDAEDEIIVLHSSLIHLKLGEEIKWPLLSALKRLVEKGHTIAIPTFTLSFPKTGLYDPIQTPSEVGILGNWFRACSHVQRTLHPIYSFAIVGPLVDEINQTSTTYCFGQHSIFNFFSLKRTRIILLGCDYSSTTQFHFYEEAAQVPYRYYKTLPGFLVQGVQKTPINHTLFVRDMMLNPINDFTEIARQLEQHHLVRHQPFASGSARSFREQDAREIAESLLEKDPYALLKNKIEVRYALHCKQERDSKAPLKIALLGSHNLSLLADEMQQQMPAYFKSQTVKLFSPAFGQMGTEIMDTQSALAIFNPDYLFFTDTLEDIFKVTFLEEIDIDDLGALETYGVLIQQCAEKFSGKIFVNDFLQMYPAGHRHHDADDPKGVARLIVMCNEKLKQLTKDHSSIQVISLSEIRLRFHGECLDPRLWYIGKLRYTKAFYAHLALQYSAIVLAASGNTIRLIILDLDHTLWGGVLGEEGLEGLQLGGDYPGNAYQDFQRALLKLTERGIALAVVSKNDEDLALQAIDTHPDMLIRSTHLAAYAINWQEKTDNLLALSTELNIGLEHILFIDDNPIERAKVNSHLPAVKVLDLPKDPVHYVNALASSPFIECLTVTDEDKKRIQYYTKKRVLAKQQGQFSTVEDFLHAQCITLHIHPLTASIEARAIQLLHKTNQFNTTTKRYSALELQQLSLQGYLIFVVGVSDVLTEYENIGLFILNPIGSATLSIDSFLLSCRVLGRGIESAMLSWIAHYAKQKTYTAIQGEIQVTPRNTPVRDLYQKHGFDLATHVTWMLNLASKNIISPAWIKFIDHTLQEQVVYVTG